MCRISVQAAFAPAAIAEPSDFHQEFTKQSKSSRDYEMSVLALSASASSPTSYASGV
jgi:hypothetical protein